MDGRTKEGRAVRKFLAEESLEYQTTAWEKVDDIELDDQQIEFTKKVVDNETTHQGRRRGNAAPLEN